MHAPSIQLEIEQLQKRLRLLQEEAETQLREQLKEARKVVADLEMQLSEITNRPTASQIKAAAGFAPLTDEQLEVQILFVLQKAPEGLNAAEIGRQLNQAPHRLRQWIKKHPGKLRREGAGPATRFFGPTTQT